MNTIKAILGQVGDIIAWMMDPYAAADEFWEYRTRPLVKENI